MAINNHLLDYKKGEGGNRTRDTGFADQRITTLLPRH